MNWNSWNLRWTSLVLVAVACTLSGSVRAAEGREAEQRSLPGFLGTLDQDKDGALSESELDQAGKALRAMDTDGDGKIQAGEIRRGRGNPRSTEAAPSDDPRGRRQGRGKDRVTTDGDRDGGRPNRDGAGARAVESERGQGGRRQSSVSDEPPVRERRREQLQRPETGPRSPGDVRRPGNDRGPRGEARREGGVRSGGRQEGRPAMAHQDRGGREGRARFCPGCGRPMAPVDGRSGAPKGRGPGGRG